MPAKPAAQLAVGATLAIKRSKTSVSKAQRRVQEHVQIDERETARRVRLDEARASQHTLLALLDEEVVGAQIRRGRNRASYCSRTSTLSAAPAASVTLSRTKPGPSGSKNSVRSSFLVSSGMPFITTVRGGVPPEILMGRGAGASPAIAVSSRLAPFGGNTMCSGRVKR